jgi:hypothetical protein
MPEKFFAAVIIPARDELITEVGPPDWPKIALPFNIILNSPNNDKKGRLVDEQKFLLLKQPFKFYFGLQY